MSENTRYKLAVMELINKGFRMDLFFDYDNSDKAILFEIFYNFCQTNLDDHCKQYDIQPARFYYSPDIRVNAKAYQAKDYYLIEVFMGLIIKLYDHFYNYNDGFDREAVLKKRYVPLFEKDMAPGFFMYQAATQFTYYHELGHLIQRSPQLLLTLEEEYLSGAAAPFDSHRHLLEFDADVHAAHYITFHVLEYWRKMPPGRRERQMLQHLMALAVSSIFTYFTFLEGRETTIYYAEKIHPHPLVRITYIMDFMVHVAEINLEDVKPDSSEILLEAFDISERMAISNHRLNPIERYASVYAAERTNLSCYINLLISESDKIPSLVKNRFNDNGLPKNI